VRARDGFGGWRISRGRLGDDEQRTARRYGEQEPSLAPTLLRYHVRELYRVASGLSTGCGRVISVFGVVSQSGTCSKGLRDPSRQAERPWRKMSLTTWD
jgi:hypothetical protein